MCVCERERVGYGELFLGIPDKDEEGGWIQTASVPGPERHPAVAWRWKAKGGDKGNVCISAENTSVTQNNKAANIKNSTTEQRPSVMLT